MNQPKFLQPHALPPDTRLSNRSQINIATSDYRQRFIDDYLNLRMYDLTDSNRAIVAEGIQTYAGGDLAFPRDLIIFLDNLYSI